ncbi:ABC transporter permease [Acidobacteriota bacterium]
MIKFLFKGLMRDRSRSLFPVLVVMSGVMMTVMIQSWMEGAMGDFISTYANFNSGHVKIMSRAYARESDKIPNDLAYIGVESLLRNLRRDYPDMVWTPRIRFGGLLDIPDESGETRAQGPAVGLAVDLFSRSSPEYRLLNLDKSVVQGRLPQNPGEILLSDDFARRLGVKLGETATLISSTMYGSMATSNFIVVGTVHFGVSAMDRGAMMADISDVQTALDMQDAAGEVLGFLSDFLFNHSLTASAAASFNERNSRLDDEFSPVMVPLRDQFGGFGFMIDIVDYISAMFIAFFVVVMSIVLWNAGLLATLRRYGEIGVRLAIGESKGHVYRTLLLESLMIGIIGSFIGTALGLAFAYFFQAKGLNIGALMQRSSIMTPDVMRTRVTSITYIIGFAPGVLATFLGTAISGIGVYKRKTSQLMKDLEV